MATRTFKIYGAAYDENNTVSLSITFNSVLVFDGVVPTIASTVPDPSIISEELASFEIDETWWPAGAVPCEITVTGGTAIIAAIGSNKWRLYDPAAHFKFSTPTSSPRIKKNITLDGMLLDVEEAEDGWHYLIPDGSTLALDWNLPPIKPAMPGY